MEAWKAEMYYGELYHHGIKGMHWGKKNGPPYPLDEEDHSANEKKEGYEKSIDSNGRNEELYDRNKKKPSMADNLKRAGKSAKSSAKNLKKSIDKTYERELQEHKERLEKMSPEDRERLQKVAKGILIAGAVVGMSAAAIYVYKNHGAEIADSLAKKNGFKDFAAMYKKDPNGAKEVFKSAMSKAADDVAMVTGGGDIVLNAGRQMRRIDASADFDMQKAGDFLFASVNDQDADVYKAIYQGRDASGKAALRKYEIAIEAVKDIIAPSRENTNNIVKEMLDKDPEFRMDVVKDIAAMYKKNNPSLDHDRAMVMADLALKYDNKHDDAYKIIQALGNKEGQTGKKIIEEFSKRGYNAVVDFHDIDDKLSQMPMIIFNPDSALVKKGQKEVTRKEVLETANKLLGMFSRNEGVGSKQYQAYIGRMLAQVKWNI